MRPLVAALRPRPSPVRARRTCRGAATVEFCLTIAFLFAPILLMLDFTKKASERARAHGPTREVVWTAARDSSRPGATTTKVMNVVASLITKPDTSVQTGADADSGGTVATAWTWMSDSVFGHIAGQIVARRHTGGTRTIVYLDSDPQNPCVGWFDPVGWIKDLFTAIFTDIRSLLPSKFDTETVLDLLSTLVGSIAPAWFEDVTGGGNEDADLDRWAFK